MFSTDSFKYLKSLASKHRENLPRPAAFEDEFILYAETLVKGLNFSTHRKYTLEYALPPRTDQDGMEAMILREGWPDDTLSLRVCMSGSGKFFLEIHASFEQLDYRASHNQTSSRKLFNSLYEKTGFSRYFTIHSEGALGENRHFIRYEMPLRQMRSRNLVEYSIFVLGQAAPFVAAALKMSEESREAVAA